jgi:hypothetical protein
MGKKKSERMKKASLTKEEKFVVLKSRTMREPWGEHVHL